MRANASDDRSAAAVVATVATVATEETARAATEDANPVVRARRAVPLVNSTLNSVVDSVVAVVLLPRKEDGTFYYSTKNPSMHMVAGTDMYSRGMSTGIVSLLLA